MPAIYPFTAIVGQERMKRALILNAVDTRIGGVLIRGERGTAKSTAARALAALLPRVQVVQDCRFGCDPERPSTWCTECKERFTAGGKLPTAERATQFVNLPVSATEDRVVGTLDIEQAIQKGERHFEPGVLASANRGLLYIDEVNFSTTTSWTCCWTPPRWASTPSSARASPSLTRPASSWSAQ
jgi:Mg-chelatase subunit ChlI